MASSLHDVVIAAEQSLWEIKLAKRPKSFWYPHPILTNIDFLERLLAGTDLNLLQLCRGEYGKIADIGTADGDLAFFLEKQGLSVDVIDNESSNFNRLEGARILKEALNSSVKIQSIDLDSQFALPNKQYDAIFLLGTLYHLKNPFFVLERLAKMTRYCFLSTRIAKQTPDGLSLSRYPIAYLLGREECNNDDTNFWIFSDEGLRRLIDRTGWMILSYITIGDTINSTPSDPDRDERAFCLLLGKIAPTVIASPNPVPAGEGIGETTIRWTTADERDGKVYVSVNGREESLFGGGPCGSAAANWIKTDCTYEFRLYDSDHRSLLAKVRLTRATQ